jgi:hypothetical protein
MYPQHSSLRISVQCSPSWPDGSTHWGLEPTVTTTTLRQHSRRFRSSRTVVASCNTYGFPHFATVSCAGHSVRGTVSPIMAFVFQCLLGG